MTDDEVPARHGQPLMSAVARYAGAEPLRLASVVFWNVAEVGGLAALRRPAQSAPGATGQAPTGRFTCDVGVIAVGERRVFRLRLGKAPMVGASAREATLPAELLARFPRDFFADEIAAIRPLAVAVDGDQLFIRALGRRGPHLVVRTLEGQHDELAVGAEAIAAAVRTLADWPAPEDAIATIVTAPRGEVDPALARAFADRDYAEAFVGISQGQAPDVRRALALAAHAGPRLLRDLIDRSMRAGAPGLRIIIFTVAFCALLVGGGVAATVLLGASLFAGSPDLHGRIAALAAFSKFGLIAAVSIFGFASVIAGVALMVRAWRYIEARGAERRMLESGRVGAGPSAGPGTDLGPRHEALLALAALRGPRLAPAEWRDIEAAATSDAAFTDRLGASLLAMPAADREAFLAAAPAGVRRFLVRALLARKTAARSPAAQIFVGAWLLCLVVGAVGAGVEPPRASLSATDWLLLLAGATALPAIMLAVMQATQWVRARRLLRLG
ncbi:MAG TPA: hypothetical protein VGG01_00455 [Xanthobacteraceae bacterium]